MAADSLLQYQGNPGLGLGSNGDISVGPSEQVLSQIHETARDIMLMDNQRNMMKYQQKIKDRDALEDMITRNMMSAGDIDEEYRPVYNAARDKVVKQWHDMKGNLDDEDAYLKLDGLIKETNDIANHAQAKTLGMKKLHSEMAQQTTEFKKGEYDKWIKQEQSKPFWAQVDPYQQVHDFDMGHITEAKPITRELPDPNMPFGTINETTFNYADIFEDKWKHYLQQDAEAEDYTTYRDKFQQLSPQKLGMSVDNINARLKAYNDTFGYKPGDRGYAAPVNAAVAGDQVAIKDNPVEFAAKYALATQQGWKSVTPGKFNKDAANAAYNAGRLKLGAEKNAIDWYKAHTGRMNYKLRFDAFQNMNKQQQEIAQSWDSMLPSMTVTDPGQPTLGMGTPGEMRISADKLPPGFVNVGGIDANGKPIPLKPIGGQWVQRMDDQGKPVKDNKGQPIRDFVGGYYEPKFFVPKGTVLPNGVAGKDMEISREDLLNKFKSSGFRGSFSDYVNNLFGQKLVDFKLAGANGTATRGSAYMSQMAESNKLTKKGQLSPFGADESDLFSQDAGDDNEGDPNQ